MALSAVATFIEALRTSELLPPAKLDEAAREAARLKDSRVLARTLLQRGWLTPFQANQLVQGRGADLILGHYILLERLGEGPRGQVFKARHRIMNRVVCLNVIRKDLLADPKAVDQFYGEVQTASQLDHPNIVHAYDAGPAGQTHLMATEFADGVDLQRLVKESGPLPVRQATAYVIQAALGLQHAAERGLVHRDIQPGNLFVTSLKKSGSGSAAVEGDLYAWGLLKILDFGLGRVLRFAGADAARLKAEHGAPEYMAPELLDAHQTADSRADIYSLGGSFFYALTGKGPPPGDKPLSLSILRPDVPGEIVEALEYMRAAKPENRIQAPSEAAQVLAGLLNFNLSGPISIPAPTAADVGETPSEPLNGEGLDETTVESGTALLSPAEAARERRLLIIAGVVLLLGLAGFAAFWFWPRGPAAAPELPMADAGASDLQTLIARVKGKQTGTGDLWQGFVDISQRQPGSAEAEEARTWLLKMPSPLDALSAAKVPPEERYAWQPKELVGVLGEHRWRHWGMPLRAVAYAPGGSVLASGGAVGAYLWDPATGRILFLLRGHTSAVNAVAFTPDGTGLVTAGADKTLKLWQVSTGQLIASFPGHGDQVTSVAFAPDGASFASGSNDKTVRIWDLRTRKERAQLKDHKGAVAAVAYAADGHTLASASHDGTVRLWDAAGKHLRTLAGHKNGASAVAFAPKEALLVSGDGEGHLRFWEPGSGKEIQNVKKHGGPLVALAFTADGHALATGSHDTQVGFWDVPSRKQQHTFKAGHAVYGIAFAPGSQPADPSAKAVLLGVTQGQLPNDLGSGDKTKPEIESSKELAGGKALKVAFAPGDSFGMKGGTKNWRRFANLRFEAFVPGSAAINLELVVVHGRSTNHQTRVAVPLKLKAGKNEVKLAIDGLSNVNKSPADLADVVRWYIDDLDSKSPTVYFSDIWLEGSEAVARLAIADAAAALQFCDLKGQALVNHKGHTLALRRVAVSPDCRTIATACADSTIKLWDVATGAERCTLTGSSGAVEAVAFSPDGQTLASAARSDKLVRLWDPATGKSKATLKGHTEAVLALAFSADGQLLASGGVDKTARLWDVAAGKEKAVCTGATALVGVVAFSPDGHTLAGGSNDKIVRLWDVSTQASKGVLKGHTAPVHGLAFSPDGLLLASAGEDKTVRLWDAATGKDKGSTLDAQTSVTGLVFTADGQWLLASGDDRCVLWKAAIRSRDRDWPLPGPVNGLATAADGRHVVTANSNGTVYILRLALPRGE